MNKIEIVVEAPTIFALDSKLGQEIWKEVYALILQQNPNVHPLELAKKTGFSRAAFWYVLHGERNATVRFAVAAANVYGWVVSITYLGKKATVCIYKKEEHDE